MTQTLYETVPGVETIQEYVDDNGNLTGAYIDGGPQGSTIEGAEIGFERYSATPGTWFAERYDGNWNLTSATLYTIANDGQHITATSLNYGPGWTYTGASVISLPEAGLGTGIDDETVAVYDANGHLTQALGQTGAQSLTGVVTANYTYGADGSSTGGNATWTVDGVSGSEIWTTGSHQLTLTPALYYSPDAPDKLTDVTFDASGQMTGAKILTFGIQGAAFTQTEEDYDASWHLISWHGQGPGYDQTVNYMV